MCRCAHTELYMIEIVENYTAMMTLHFENPALTRLEIKVIIASVAWVVVGKFAVIVELVENMAEFRIDTTLLVGSQVMWIDQRVTVSISLLQNSLSSQQDTRFATTHIYILRDILTNLYFDGGWTKYVTCIIHAAIITLAVMLNFNKFFSHKLCHAK